MTKVILIDLVEKWNIIADMDLFPKELSLLSLYSWFRVSNACPVQGTDGIREDEPKEESIKMHLVNWKTTHRSKGWENWNGQMAAYDTFPR